VHRTITTIAAGAAGALALGLAPYAIAANGPMTFDPIPGSAYDQQTSAWTEPFIAPAGCTQALVSDETVLDIYPGVDDLTDMNVTNESGRHAGRYLYRTHEVGSNGSLSVVDLETGETRVLLQDAGYRRLDGLTWTPWGTLLFAEETAGGRLFEAFLDPKDPSVVDRVEARPEVGILRHEGIGVDKDGSVYVIDELNGGSIYKFVPTTPGDLSDGQLYALKLTELDDAQQVWNQATYAEKVGGVDWVPLDMTVVAQDADAASNAVQAAGVTGFNGPDNLAVDTTGELWMVEDNTPSDIWVASRHSAGGVAEDVELFASLVDPGAEASGIYFGKDPHTLFVNIQHPEKPLADGTWAITCRGSGAMG
jgi:secreted PhoX family phosphatase